MSLEFMNWNVSEFSGYKEEQSEYSPTWVRLERAFRELKILTLTGVCIYELVCFVYKNREEYSQHRARHEFSTRNKCLLRPSKHVSSVFQKSMVYNDYYYYYYCYYRSILYALRLMWWKLSSYLHIKYILTNLIVIRPDFIK